MAERKHTNGCVQCGKSIPAATLFCCGECGKHSNLSLDERFTMGFVEAKASECWEWLFHRLCGRYGQIPFRGKTVYAHRYAWERAYGPIPPGKFVLHHCDNPPCVNYKEHLFLGTQRENMADKVAKGRQSRVSLAGELHGMAKLTEDDVLTIRSRTDSIDSLAFEYDVGRSCVKKIRARHTWAHLP